MGELVGEHADVGVLRNRRVVADPDARVADLGAAGLVRIWAGLAVVGPEGVPAVAPNGVLALGAAAGLLALAGVHDLDPVDVAVRLVEVAVAVEVVAVVGVVLRQVGGDLVGAPAVRHLVGVPRVDGVVDEVPVAVGLVVVVAVTRLVVGQLDPVADLAGHRVAAGGLGDEVVGAGHVARRLGEEQPLVEVLAVVRLPGRRVVLRPVGLGDLVVQRPRVTAVLGLVAELGQDHEDLVGGLAGQLDVLPGTHLDDLGRPPLLDLGLAADHLLQCCLLERALLLGQRTGPVVDLPLRGGLGIRSLSGPGPGRRDLECGSTECNGGRDGQPSAQFSQRSFLPQGRRARYPAWRRS